MQTLLKMNKFGQPQAVCYNRVSLYLKYFIEVCSHFKEMGKQNWLLEICYLRQHHGNIFFHKFLLDFNRITFLNIKTPI
jgi:hypothetical protein